MGLEIVGIESWMKNFWDKKWVWHQWVNQDQIQEYDQRNWWNIVEHWKTLDMIRL